MIRTKDYTLEDVRLVIDQSATVLCADPYIEDYGFLDEDDDWWVKEGWVSRCGY